MARYIKVNPKVASFLNLQDKRNTVKDGNYLLWQADILPFGPLTQLPTILSQIGGIALLPHEARQEQDGTNTRQLPVATDERFAVEVETEADSEESIESEVEPDEESAEDEAKQADTENEVETDNNQTTEE